MYGHITLADNILKEQYGIECNLSVEKLCSLGWIAIQSGFIGYTGAQVINLIFTKEQEEFLLNKYDEFSYGQQVSLKTTLEISNMLKEDVQLGRFIR
jgi:hypothetical protein